MTVRDVTETLSTLTNTSLLLVTSTKLFSVSFPVSILNFSLNNFVSTEVDGLPEEVEESLGILQTLGFTENKEISEGHRTWIGSVMVLVKQIQS